MAASLNSIEAGLDYQAYLFWIEAARLLLPTSSYDSVGFELSNIKSLDDVATFHKTPPVDCRGDEYNADFYQIKFHVDYRAQISAVSLTDPAFIGASTVSFLQRLKTANSEVRKNGKKPRFFLTTPWTIDPNDLLGSLVGAGEGEIKIEKIAQASAGSKLGKLRTSWKAHLGLETDAELLSLLGTLRIQAGERNFQQLKRNLNDSLIAAGLRPIGEANRTDPYPQLIRKLRAEGKIFFQQSQIRDACGREGLIICNSEATGSRPRRIGIRSFYRFAENMESETDRSLSLLHHFDGRPIKDSSLWHSKVVPEIQELISTEISGKADELEFHLDTHLTCAVLAGYFTDPKAGKRISVLQRTMSARESWKNEATEADQSRARINVQETKDFSNGCSDEAITLSIAQPIFSDVVDYIQRNSLRVGRAMKLEIDSGAGNSRIESGGHATAIVEQIRNVIKERRSAIGNKAKIHLFLSAPNSIAFFLGRLLPSTGPIQLYEHNFDGSLPDTYMPSIELTNQLQRHQ